MVRPLLCLRQRAPLFLLGGDNFVVPGLEHIGAALQEQRAENLLLELRGIHLAAQDVGGREEVTFKLGESCGHVFGVAGWRRTKSPTIPTWWPLPDSNRNVVSNEGF